MSKKIIVDQHQLDVYLVDSDTKASMGRPWLVTSKDSESQIIVGTHITSEPLS